MRVSTQERFVMDVPIALKHLRWVVCKFLGQEYAELWIADLDLLPVSPPMMRQIEAADAGYTEID